MQKYNFFFETAKFYGIFSVIITRMSIFQATLYGFFSRSCLGCESVIARSRGWFGEGGIANGTMTGKRLVYRLLSELHRGHTCLAAEEIKMNFISYFTTFKRLFKKNLAHSDFLLYLCARFGRRRRDCLAALNKYDLSKWNFDLCVGNGRNSRKRSVSIRR